MATSILNILHMSDLHYKATSSHDHDTVIEAFLADLKTISTGSLRPDLVMSQETSSKMATRLKVMMGFFRRY